jgi:hypothetical protein
VILFRRGSPLLMEVASAVGSAEQIGAAANIGCDAWMAVGPGAGSTAHPTHWTRTWLAVKLRCASQVAAHSDSHDAEEM